MPATCFNRSRQQVFEISVPIMPLCGASKATTPLQRYANLLAEQRDADEADAPLLHFPMYVLALPLFMDMNEIQPHEVLKDRGMLVEFDKNAGNAAFVSHQWVGNNHPDPELKQLRVLQEALEHVMSDMQYISLDLNTEFLVAGVPCLDAKALREKPLFLWYDYFSCPQLDLHARQLLQESGLSQSSQLAHAIESIPAYIARCSFFFALCPVVYSPKQSMVFTPTSWAERGWCRVVPCVLL